MKLLISAYACRPNNGSEPAVGWSWVLELCRHHQLFVLTNWTNKPYIEKYRCNHAQELKNVTFVYVRPARWLTFWYKEWQRLERLYYLLWQRKALYEARRLHKSEHFDCVQHLTYVTCILPTYMHKLGIPFIYGPISGGERIPACIGLPMTKRECFVERVRMITQVIPRLSPNTRAAFARASKIIVVTEDTKSLVPRRYWDKTIVSQAIGLPESFLEDASPRRQTGQDKKPCRVLMVGRLLAWKGFQIGIEAVRMALDHGADIELTIIGNDRFDQRRKLATLAGKFLGRQIRLADPVPFERMKECYDSFDLLLNCSMRDSGCMVVMEAMARGLPVICIDTGGPKVNTIPAAAVKIQPKPYQEMTREISQALAALAASPQKRQDMSLAAYCYARKQLTMPKKISDFLKIYDEAISDEESAV